MTATASSPKLWRQQNSSVQLLSPTSMYASSNALLPWCSRKNEVAYHGSMQGRHAMGHVDVAKIGMRKSRKHDGNMCRFVLGIVQLVHLKTIRVEELGVVGGVGVVQAEGCYGIPGVIALWKHAEVCEGCEQSSHIFHCPANWPSDVTVQH